MPATAPPPLEELAKYPTMTRWFRPGLLAKLLWRVVVSELFGQYADRRLIVAALDTVSDDELIERAQQFAPGSGNEDCTLTPDPEGAVWIDYVADLGDGFDATYAIASLLAQETLTIAGHVTRRGQILMMGGRRGLPQCVAGNLSAAVARSIRLGVSRSLPQLKQRTAGLRDTGKPRLV
jgi:hypothetical protein